MKAPQMERSTAFAVQQGAWQQRLGWSTNPISCAASGPRWEALPYAR